jgi:nucleotide-binding universal stress UspA family protein
LLEKASVIAAGTDTILTELIRYNSDIINGITGVVKENKATDMILGLHNQRDLFGSFLGQPTEGILKNCNNTTFIYKNFQPLNTVNNYLVVLPSQS